MSSDTPLPPDELLAHREFLERFARRLAHDASVADDVVQETWLAALERPPRDRTNLRGWLRQVARNVLMQRRRRAAPSGSSLDDLPSAPSSAPSIAPGDALDRQTIAHVLASGVLSLPEPYRRVLVLRFYEEKTPTEIARELDRPVNTVISQMSRGLKLLHEKLDRQRPGGPSAWMSVLAWLERNGTTGVRTGGRRAARTATAAGGRQAKTWLVAAAAVIAAPLLVLVLRASTSSETVPQRAELAREPELRAPVPPDVRDAPQAAPAGTRDALPQETRGTQRLPDVASASTDSTPLLVSGAAIRVDPQGAEHSGEEGELTLVVQQNGKEERLHVPVRAGQFAVDVPPRARIFVSRLVLGGRLTRPPQVHLKVPADRFLLVRGDELRDVLLHVTAEDGRELEDVEVFSTPDSRRIAWGRRHPGIAPERSALVRDGRSPLWIAPTESAFYWVRAPGHAWMFANLDHVVGGERTLVLQPACALEVELAGLESWLQPSVRLWPAIRFGEQSYAFAERAPDDAAHALFEALPPGDYVVSAERDASHGEVSFGRATVTIAAGERAFVRLPLELPERPREVEVSGRLLVHPGWELDDLCLSFVARGAASMWAAEPVSLARSEMSVVVDADPALAVFAWKTTLPSAGDYQLNAVSPAFRQSLTVPSAGVADVEVVVPGAAEVDVHVLDEESGAELEAATLSWSSQGLPRGHEDSIRFSVSRDAARGCVSFRAPAGEVFLFTEDPAVRVADEPARFVVRPGHNRLELRARRSIGVRIQLSDGGRILPWSWNWALRASRIGDEASEEQLSVGALWFREPGTYQLFAGGGVPGYAAIDGFTFEVRPLAPDEKYLDVVVPLEPEER